MFKLPKQRILKDKAEFQRVYRGGESYANRYLVLYVFMANGPKGKVGFAAGKKLGNAVERNRVKRLLRECYRLHQQQLEKNCSYLLVGRKAAVTAGFAEVEKAFLNLGRKARVLAGQGKKK